MGTYANNADPGQMPQCTASNQVSTVALGNFLAEYRKSENIHEKPPKLQMMVMDKFTGQKGVYVKVMDFETLCFVFKFNLGLVA